MKFVCLSLDFTKMSSIATVYRRDPNILLAFLKAEI